MRDRREEGEAPMGSSQGVVWVACGRRIGRQSGGPTHFRSPAMLRSALEHVCCHIQSKLRALALQARTDRTASDAAPGRSGAPSSRCSRAQRPVGWGGLDLLLRVAPFVLGVRQPNRRRYLRKNP